MINDPGAWGSDKPEYLILGFSKGSTQAGIYDNGRFEDVAFAKMRGRLSEVLKALGLISQEETVDERIADPKSKIAFGSLIRCSVSRADDKNGIYSCTGPIINKSFNEIPDVIANCSEKYLKALPRELKAVIMLGNSDQYVKAVRRLLERMFSGTYRVINDMAVWADGKVWVHTAHPSGLNGHFNTWLTSETSSGYKRIQALDAMTQITED
ncbi:hypothetical protein [Salinimonas lutimaris]|uniref:hypothetical protein n=1 Tax=Salinimonas lutimaris TaxID=914153 RepID=UPI0010BF6F6F|nr:hypothetical protein [Salinimonas lutimaris]